MPLLLLSLTHKYSPQTPTILFTIPWTTANDINDRPVFCVTAMCSPATAWQQESITSNKLGHPTDKAGSCSAGRQLHAFKSRPLTKPHQLPTMINTSWPTWSKQI